MPTRPDRTGSGPARENKGGFTRPTQCFPSGTLPAGGVSDRSRPAGRRASPSATAGSGQSCPARLGKVPRVPCLDSIEPARPGRCLGSLVAHQAPVRSSRIGGSSYRCLGGGRILPAFLGPAFGAERPCEGSGSATSRNTARSFRHVSALPVAVRYRNALRQSSRPGQ